MGFSALRVINENFVAPSMGFGKHPHCDMEILTYVLEGAVKHEDSMGSSETLVPGELQHMSAGSGVRHSEMNPSSDETLHLLQIWLVPNKMGIPPKYEQKKFPIHTRPNQLHLLASPNADPTHAKAPSKSSPTQNCSQQNSTTEAPSPTPSNIPTAGSR